MSVSTIAALLSVVLGGVALAVQAPVNAALGRSLADTALAACISFGVGFLALALLSLARGAWTSIGSVAAVPWWAWTGGLLGACYVFASIWSVPKLGVVTTLAAAIFGQLAAALVLDAVGAFGVPVHAVTATRLVAVVLVMAGLVLSRL